MKPHLNLAPRISADIHLSAPSLMPAQPWWQTLDSNFNALPDDLAISGLTRGLVRCGAALDIVTRTALGSLLSVTAMRRMFWPANLNRAIREGACYRQLADQRDPARVFAAPPHLAIRENPPGRFHRAPRGAHCTTLSFASPYQPVNPRMPDYLEHSENLTAKAEYWRHGDRPRPTICFVHGFMLHSYTINSLFMCLPWFFKQGYDILLYTLPFHGTRQSRKSPHSGHGYFSDGLSRLNETMLHAIFDFRIFLNYLERQGTPQFGVTGLSLGGYTTSLMASVDDRLAFAIPNVPVSCIPELFMLWNPMRFLVQAGMKYGGATLEEIRHTLAIHSPLTYQPLIPKERLMIVAGAGDRTSPPNQARVLWDHWGRPNIHWFPGNHVIHLDQGHYLKEMAGFMRGIGFTA